MIRNGIKGCIITVLILMIPLVVSGSNDTPTVMVQSRSPTDPVISYIDSHQRQANWSFDNISGYGAANLTPLNNGTGLTMNSSDYSYSDYLLYPDKAEKGYPSAGINSKDEVILAWSESKLVSQKIDSDGNMIGDKIVVCSNPGMSRIGMNSQDGYIITWQDYRYSLNVFARIFDNAGNRIGNEINLLNASNPWDSVQEWPNIAVDSNDDFIITYYGSRGQFGGVWAQRFFPDGTRTGPEILVHNGSYLFRTNIGIATDSQDNFIIVWSDNRNGSGWQVHFQRYDDQGNLNGSEVTVHPSNQNQSNPDVGIDSNDNYIITWQEDVNGFGNPGPCSIAAMRFTRDGAQIGGRMDIASAQNNVLGDPLVALDFENNILVAWGDEVNGSYYARFFNEKAELFGNRIRLANYDDRWTIRFGSNTTFYMVSAFNSDQKYINARQFKKGAYAPEGSLLLQDFEVPNLVCWNNLSLNFTLQNKSRNAIHIHYSTDAGGTWFDVLSNRSLANASSTSKKIRFRIDLLTNYSRTTPILYGLALNYTTNDPPTIVSIGPSGIDHAPKRQAITLSATTVDPDGDIVVLSWKQNGGPPVELSNYSIQNPTFTPDRIGPYSFEVLAFDGYILSEPRTVNITVVNHAPVPKIIYEGFAQKKAPFKVLGTVQDEDNDTCVFDWSLVSAPPGTLLENANSLAPTITCPSSGNYTLVLTTTDEGGSLASASATVLVTGQTPKAMLSASLVPQHPGTELGFSGAGSSDSDGDGLSYFFDFGDGNNTGWIFSSNTTHRFGSPGVYNVTLTVIDTDGNLSIPASVSVTVLPFDIPPRASFTILEGNLVHPYRFDSISTDDDGTIVSQTWDFGDGTDGSGISVSHLYTSGGNYTISLSVKDDDGIVSVCRTVVRINRLPIIQKISPRTDPVLEYGNTVEMSVVASDSDGDSLRYSWFVDGAAIDNGNGSVFRFYPRHSGIFNITITVSDGRGGSVGHGWNVLVKGKTREWITLGDIKLVVALIILIGTAITISIYLFRHNRRKEIPAEEGEK